MSPRVAGRLDFRDRPLRMRVDRVLRYAWRCLLQLVSKLVGAKIRAVKNKEKRRSADRLPTHALRLIRGFWRI
jgi:hypothetical protein